METNELIKIWKTLAEKKLIDNDLARENILQIITIRGFGLLEKLAQHVKREIIVDVITSGLVTFIIVGVFIYQRVQSIDKKAHIVLFVILVYFLYKLINDIRKYKLLKANLLTDSIKDSTLNSYNKFKLQIKQDLVVAISFIVSVNLYAIYIYYKAFGDYTRIDFTYLNINSIGFILLILLVFSLIITPLGIKYFFKRKYQSVINNFESTIAELNSENE